MAGASRQQGDALLNLFYPDHDAFWLGLLPGVPAVLAFLVSGHRQRLPRLWPRCAGCWCYRNAAAALAAAAMAERRIAFDADHRLLVADIYAFWWLLASRRLAPVFRKIRFNGTFCRSCTPTCVELTERIVS
jgi:hypothetical protein